MIELIKRLTPGLKCKYVRGEENCTFVDVDETEPRVNALTPVGDKHSIAGSYLEKFADGIQPFSPFNISQLMNNSGSNRPIIETIVAHTAEFYWIQVERAKYVVWIPTKSHEPGQLVEWTDLKELQDLDNQNKINLSKSAKAHRNNGLTRNYIELLLEKHNLVLTGAPGTGKTYTAKAIAANLISGGTSDWDGLTEEQRKQVGFVQFHPSYDYTDFVEGLRPDEDGSFRRQDGIFKAFCKRATESSVIANEKCTNTAIAGTDIDKLFEEVFSNLIKDIRRGRISSYRTISGKKYPLSLRDNKIIFRQDSSDHVTTINEVILRLLFSHFVEHNIFKIENIERDSTNYVIWELAQIKTITANEYVWALNQLFDRIPEDIKSNQPNVKCGNCINQEESLPEKEPRSKKLYIFIIDEINRGELSKIFGELFYAIEPDYRGKAETVQTQYNNLVEEGDIFKSGFYIPENVYIIGTMNDVDRGVEAMDFAIRRRFAWVEVTAEESAENMGIKDLALAKMNALNAALKDNGLSRAYYIGGAYFRKLKGDDYDSLWKYHLEGIVYEYFRGEPDAEDKLQAVKKAFDETSLPSYDTHESTESATEK